MGLMPERGIRLTRISDARDDDTKGVDAQGTDCDTTGGHLGWRFGPAATHHIIENDTSAFKRKMITLPDGRRELRTVRPGFRQALAMLADGRADGLMAYDLDRAVRDPRDLEDLIDVVEGAVPRIPVESVTGSLRLANDSDITMARVMVAVGNKASRDTARRGTRARVRQAEEGAWGGGKRPFGFGPDGVTPDPEETAEIRRAADAILAGVSLRQVTASLRDRGVPTVTGAAWSTVTVRDMLLRPRNAALMVYRPNGGRGPRKVRLYTDADITGPAPWAPVIPEAAALGERRDEQAPLHVAGVIDGQQLAAGSASARADLKVIQAQLDGMSWHSALEGIAGNPDAAQVWAGFDLGRKRAILREVVTVTIHPAAKRGSRFGYETVLFGPWHHE